ncbi:histidinol-phosphate transaminase [Tichowtungia aerotolerans]|uniref:Histidinol-phosphate aminotransferase n=1 Tax=Tichowtungia aerotolerans TaxID=2697043 RepID=A0A6P1M406_9BACT|nr:histidinol-phosphate transaminase [Tichowtungia aerotolerans]QHI69579.1 histidinol-phosphate transaminase [Tichowtungia aerotolerans]
MKTNEWIPKVPVYQPGKPITEVARELGFDDIDEIIKVASNENELGPSPKALEAMAAEAAEMHRYPDGGGFYLKRRLAEKLGVKPENIMLGNGSNELIEFLGHAYLQPGANLVMSEGAFVVYRLVAALFCAETIAAPMKNFGHDLDAMLDAITPETRIVTICNPNNPTGTIITPDEIDAFIEKLPDHVLAVFDEAYFELAPENVQADVLKHIRAGRKNVMVMRTFSKAYGLAGLRIGYGIAHEEVVETLNHVRQPFNANAMAQAAALAALDDDDHIAQTREMVFQGLELFAEKLPTIGKGLEFVPSYANFILVKTGNGAEVFAELQKRKVIVRPMAGYGLPDWVRITIGTPEQNTQVLKALAEVV